MAFKVVVDLGQAQRVVKAIEKMPRALTKSLSNAVRESAKLTAQEARKTLRGGGRGSRRGRRAGSEAGQPPGRQTGALAKSIGFKRGSRSGLSYLVEAREFYGRFLETGTSRGLQPRPFLTLAQENLSESNAARIIAGIEDVLKEAARA